MASLNLTAAAIEALRYDPTGPSVQALWDKKVAGLGVRVTPANGKQYVLRYRRHGRQRLMSLGLVRDFRNVADARDAALEYLRKLRREDVDPLLERARQKAAGTCRELFARWLEHVAAKRKASTHAEYTRHVDGHLDPEFGNHRPTDVTRPEVRKLHARISSSSGAYMANSVLRSLRAAINWAKRQDDGTLPENHPNPVVGVEFNREKARDEHFRAQELPAVARAIEQESDPWVRGYLWLLLLTSARKSELLQLRWPQVHLELRELVFADTKNGDDFRVRLTDAAIAIIEQIPRIAGSDYVFPSRRSDAKRPHMSGPRVAWAAVQKRAGVHRRVTFHDVRRSMGTALARAGYTAEQIAGLLNHKSPVTAKHYIRLASDTQQAMAKELAAITAAEPAANADQVPEDASTAA